MIDYKKLQIVHELVSLIKTHYMIHFITEAKHELRLIAYDANTVDFNADDLDHLIERLQELIQSKPALKDAWYFDNGIKVTKVSNGKFFAACKETELRAVGRKMYDSRELLIEDNLKTWSKLYEETHPGFLCLIQEVKPYKSSTDTPTPGAWI